MFKTLRPFAILLALSRFAVPVLAQDDEEMDPPEQEKVENDAKKYEEAIKDATKYEGAFTLYHKKSQILLELPEANLGKLHDYLGV